MPLKYSLWYHHIKLLGSFAFVQTSNLLVIVYYDAITNKIFADQFDAYNLKTNDLQ